MSSHTVLCYLRGDDFTFFIGSKRYVLKKGVFYNAGYNNNHYYLDYSDITQIMFNNQDFHRLFIINRHIMD